MVQSKISSLGLLHPAKYCQWPLAAYTEWDPKVYGQSSIHRLDLSCIPLFYGNLIDCQKICSWWSRDGASRAAAGVLCSLQQEGRILRKHPLPSMNRIAFYLCKYCCLGSHPRYRMPHLPMVRLTPKRRLFDNGLIHQQLVAVLNMTFLLLLFGSRSLLL